MPVRLDSFAQAGSSSRAPTASPSQSSARRSAAASTRSRRAGHRTSASHAAQARLPGSASPLQLPSACPFRRTCAASNSYEGVPTAVDSGRLRSRFQYRTASNGRA
eukprot:6189133-Pleurochrysis_carterae.AAC.3